MAAAPATSAGASSRSAAPRRSPRRCRWWRRRRCARRSRRRSTRRPFARLLYRIQRSATTRAIDFTHPLLEVREVAQARGHPRRRRQGPVRRAQHQRVPRSRRSSIRQSTRLHHRRPQGGAVRRPHAAGSWPPSSPTATRRRSPRRARSRRFARDLFLKGEVDEVQIVATRFVNTLTQEPVVDRVPAGRRDHGPAGAGRRTPRRRWPPTRPRRVFEPDAEAILGYLLGHYLNIYIYYRAAERQGERAERADGVDEERHRQRRRR